MTIDRIVVDPARMHGQPTMRTVRLSVRRVLQLVALYPDRDELRREFPDLEDVRQSLLRSSSS